ncbi:putative uncharacterized protein [Firmicutes bacterium CAG:145]|nr:putative uncharacterized protein [Firmicutes bacterium CAG:145]
MKANVGFSDKEIMKAQKKYAKMSDEELCEMIRKKTQELGRTPRVGEIPAARDIKRRLGAWPRVLEKAGVKEPSEIYLRRVEARKVKRLKKKERHRKTGA